MAGRPRNEQTRGTILRRAADIASVNGLEGLSIGSLATDLGVSKSGLFGYFGSKEKLQLSTVEAATAVYQEEVIRPALETEPGLGRVRRLCESWLAYSQRRTFPGGCFFFTVSAEFGPRSGPVHEALAAANLAWSRLVARTVREARELGEATEETDPEQLAFELIAFMEAANAASLLHDSPAPYQRAATAIRDRLDAAAAPAALPD